MLVTGPSRLDLKEQAQAYRRESVSDSTKKSREMQWRCYVTACRKYGWQEFPCGLEQACLYVTYLADRLSYSSVIAYYNAVVYMHVCLGREPIRLSNPVLKATVEGIGRVKGRASKGKDPLFPSHLKKVAKVVNVHVGWEVLVFTCMLFLFRTLLRVSHVVRSPHTLLECDVKFNAKGMLVAVGSSKTSRKGESVEFLPVVYAGDNDVCAVKWLKKFLKMYPKAQGDPLFSFDAKPVFYSKFLNEFHKLIKKARVEGNFATHSLRRGGARHMSMSGCSVAEVKERGRWKSDCVFKYIRQPLMHMLKVDKKVVENV